MWVEKPKEHHVCEKYYIWNPATGSWENSGYATSFIEDSVITFDEIIEETKQNIYNKNYSNKF